MVSTCFRRIISGSLPTPKKNYRSTKPEVSHCSLQIYLRQATGESSRDRTGHGSTLEDRLGVPHMFPLVFPYPRCSMVLEYLPTFPPKLPSFVGKYSSTMEHLGIIGVSWTNLAFWNCPSRKSWKIKQDTEVLGTSEALEDERGRTPTFVCAKMGAPTVYSAKSSIYITGWWF